MYVVINSVLQNTKNRSCAVYEISYDILCHFRQQITLTVWQVILWNILYIFIFIFPVSDEMK